MVELEEEGSSGEPDTVEDVTPSVSRPQIVTPAAQKSLATPKSKEGTSGKRRAVKKEGSTKKKAWR